MKTPVDIALTAAEHRRGHGAMAVDVTELAVRTGRRVRPQPLGAIHCQDQAPVGGLGLRQPGQHLPQLWCIDVPAVQGFVRSGHSSDQFVPGLPYWFVAALESGRTSWCQILDALRLGPTGDVAEVAADQVRQVVTDLIETGRWKPGDLDIMVVFDAGYDAPRMAHLLAGLPVEVLGRMRTDRAMRKRVPVPWISPPQGRHTPKQSREFRFAKPDSTACPPVTFHCRSGRGRR